MGEYSAGTLDRVFSAVSDAHTPRHPGPSRRSDARVTDVARAFPISLNSTSKHIRVLEGAGLVRRSGAGPRAHLEPRCGTTRRGGRMDRALPQVLERSARLARRLRHRPRQRGEVVVTDELLGHRPAGDRRPGGSPLRRVVGRAEPRLVAQAVRHSGDSCRNRSACRRGVPHRHGRRRVRRWCTPAPIGRSTGPIGWSSPGLRPRPSSGTRS